MSSPEMPVIAFKKCNEKGFSLVEVLVALFVFMVGALAVALVLDMSIQSNSSARLISEATEIAQSQMEKLMSASYDDAELDGASSPYGPNPIADYSVTWTVQEDVPLSDMKTIRLTVAWSDRGENKSLSVDSLKQ